MNLLVAERGISCKAGSRRGRHGLRPLISNQITLEEEFGTWQKIRRSGPVGKFPSYIMMMTIIIIIIISNIIGCMGGGGGGGSSKGHLGVVFIAESGVIRLIFLAVNPHPHPHFGLLTPDS